MLGVIKMRNRIILLTLLLNIILFGDLLAQTMPLVYEVENTGADCPQPILPSLSELPVIQELPDPFKWADGRGQISNLSDWRYRRAEIGAQIQYYEIGEKPLRPDSIEASFSVDSILTVVITVNGKTLTLTSKIILPAGIGPFPAVIGLGFGGSGSIPSTIFSSRNIAQIPFNHDQVTTYANLFTGSKPLNSDPYFRLYPAYNLDNMGQYSAWAWGVSRIIDGLELVQNVLPIDLKHICVTGCSYAGKLALFAGAFDERIALTISQESGGGGYTTWRYSEEINKIESVETLGKTDYNWFRNSMSQFSSAVAKLPEDHHELMAMCAPRALFVTGNPGWVWMADESGYVGSKAAKEVWNALGVPDRFAYSQIGGHQHCQVPSNQMPEIEAFVDKFLLGKDTTNTNIATSPYNTNLSRWITWATPALSNDTSFFGKASLVYPSNLQKSLDNSITFKWNRVEDAQKYFIQVSLDHTFTSFVISDSTTTDTVKTITGLLDGKRYFWRVKAVNIAGSSGPFSNIWNFSTYVPLPAKPQLVAATPYPDRPGWVTLNWIKVMYADQYLIQVSSDTTFLNPYFSATASDTAKIFIGLSIGQKYFGRVQANNVEDSGLWSDILGFTLAATDAKEESGIPTEYSKARTIPTRSTRPRK